VELQNGWGRLALAEAAEKYSDEVLAVLLSRVANFEVTVIDLEKIWHGDVLDIAARPSRRQRSCSGA